MWNEADVMVMRYNSGSIDQDDSSIPQPIYELNKLLHSTRLGAPGTLGNDLHQTMLGSEGCPTRPTEKPAWHEVEHHRAYYALHVKAAGHLLRHHRDNDVGTVLQDYYTVRKDMVSILKAGDMFSGPRFCAQTCLWTIYALLHEGAVRTYLERYSRAAAPHSSTGTAHQRCFDKALALLHLPPERICEP